MKKRKKILAGIGLVLVAAIGYLCWPEKKVQAPDDMVVLDKTKVKNDGLYLSEETLQEDMVNIVNPYLDERKTTGYFAGYDGQQIYYEQYLTENSKGHIVVVHGFTDGIYKYREVIYYFVKSGYSVSALEHRGHGYSYRSIGNLSKITIDSFDEYTDDLKLFLHSTVKPALKEGEKLFAYAHSMGGELTALLVEEDSTLFDAVVLTSPMMEIEFKGVPNNMAYTLARVAFLFGFEEDFIVGFSDYDGVYRFERSSYTSKARYDYIMQCEAADERYRMSGGDYKWLAAGIASEKKLLANAESYKTDTLLFQAENDTTVGPNGQNEFAARASNVQLVFVEDAKHNILFTQNDIFIPYMNTILEFYEKHID